MTRRSTNPKSHAVLFGLLIFLAPAFCLAESPTLATVSAYNAYVSTTEFRLVRQHQAPNGFVASNVHMDARLRGGEMIVEELTPIADRDLPGAMLHHWRGSAFVPAATVSDFERFMKNFNAYPQYFAPEVERGRVLSQQDDHFMVSMRVRQKHVITVVMDANYDVTFKRLDPRHGYSISRSTQIEEIDSPGTSREHPLRASEDHGFLWRQNTYWSYEERDGGLYMQIESVSLSRAIPTGLGWAVRPLVESVPRESMEFTLQATRNALKH